MKVNPKFMLIYSAI